MANRLFEIYDRDDIIAERGRGAARQVEPSNKSPLVVSNDHGRKTIRCTHVFYDYVLKGISVQRLQQTIWHIVESYWYSPKTSPLEMLAYHSTLITTWQAIADRKEQLHTYNSNQNKSNKIQSHSCHWKASNMKSSSNTSPWRSYSGK